MKHKTIARGAKLLLLLPVVALVAAGCTPQDTAINSGQVGQQQTQTPPPSQPVTKVDAMANSLSQGIAAEENAGSDAATVTLDQSILNGYSEVFNASDF